MTGETDLEKLLSTMRPQLQPGVFVFVTLRSDENPPAGIEPVMAFREREGLTCIVGEAEAGAAGLAGIFPCRMITLTVHSSLEAVGFMAAITARLARAGIGVNPVSAFHHDHLFVPAERAGEAMAILLEMAGAAADASGAG